jgi:hypothetical protein
VGSLEGAAVVACAAIAVVGAGAVVDNAVVEFAVEAVAAVAFLVWEVRAADNARALASDVEFMSRRALVLWWFVPLAGAWMPLLGMRQIVEASKAAATSSSYAATNSPWWVGAWWVAFVGSAFVDAVSEGSNDEFVFGARVVVDVIAAGLAIAVVVAVTRWQRRALKRREPPSGGSQRS